MNQIGRTGANPGVVVDIADSLLTYEVAPGVIRSYDLGQRIVKIVCITDLLHERSADRGRRGFARQHGAGIARAVEIADRRIGAATDGVGFRQ